MDIFKSMFSGFPFKSKEQTEKERRQFERRVFPLGMEQREAAAQVLRQLLPMVEAETDRLYAFIAAKDAYTQEVEEDPARALALAREAIKPLKWKKNGNEQLVIALVLLDVATDSLENYPTAEMVRQRAYSC